MEPTKPVVNIKATSKLAGDKFTVYNFDEVELPEVVEKSHEDFVTYGVNCA